MAAKGSRLKHLKKFGLILGPALFLAIIAVTPSDETLSFGAVVVLAATLWMATWWITEAIPIYVTALLPLAIFPLLGVTDIRETSASYADPIVFLFLGGFLVAKAIENSGLHKRFALTMLRIFGTKPKYIVAAFMIVTGFMSAWMSNTAITLLMLPIAVAVISQFSNSPILDSRKKEMFATCLLLSIAYSASLGGLATLIGTPPNAIFASLAQSLSDVEVSFTQWMFMAMPISAVSLFVAWWYLTNFGAKVTDIPSLAEEKDQIVSELAKLGRMAKNEKAVMAVFAATATAWITRGLIWKDALPMIDDSTIAIAAAISLFIIRVPHSKHPLESEIDTSNDFNLTGNNAGSALLDWKTAVKIPWGVLILIGGGLALANGFASTQLDDWIAGQLVFLGQTPHLIIIILAIVTVTIFSGEIISNTATAALFIPITASLAVSLGITPVLLMVPVAVAASYSFIIPISTPPNAIVFSTGHVTAAKMARVGLPMALIGVGLVTLFTSILVPLIWG
ncbi:MAG: SLC13/DASS family transporter [Nitrososphaera sp.]|jgi:sodium-dependent dicarboxylate transporter 2/3/5